MQNLNTAVLKWTSHNTDKLHWAPSCPKVFTVAGEPAQLSKRQHLHYNTHIHARTLSLSLSHWINSLSNSTFRPKATIYRYAVNCFKDMFHHFHMPQPVRWLLSTHHWWCKLNKACDHENHEPLTDYWVRRWPIMPLCNTWWWRDELFSRQFSNDEHHCNK